MKENQIMTGIRGISISMVHTCDMTAWDTRFLKKENEKKKIKKEQSKIGNGNKRRKAERGNKRNALSLFLGRSNHLKYKQSTNRLISLLLGGRIFLSFLFLTLSDL